MIRLSVIVPVYNVAPYLERCIRSLENQDIPDREYEIICINDGSSDNSRDIVIQLQKEFVNITLIDQENQGVSQARNNGIDRAVGRYLMFIDSDDYVDVNSLTGILQNADIHKAQVSFLGFAVLNEDGTIQKHYLFGQQLSQVYPGTETYFLAHGDGEGDSDRMVAVLFEKDFIDRYNLRYLPGVPYLEDGEFISRILCLADRCIFDGLPFYQRTTRPGSAMNSDLFHSEKATTGFLKAACNLKKFQQEQILNEKQRNFLNQPICKFVILVINSSQKPFNIKNINAAKEKLAGLGFGRLNLKSVDKEFNRLGSFYNVSVYLLIIYQYVDDRLSYLKWRIKKIRS
jgi:glycosyltransferase involved in cell wall biosynthesis